MRKWSGHMRKWWGHRRKWWGHLRKWSGRMVKWSGRSSAPFFGGELHFFTPDIKDFTCLVGFSPMIKTINPKTTNPKQ